MNIGITGPISEVNFGDYAMLINNMYDLGKEHHYTLYYYDTKDVTAFDNIVAKYLSDFKIKVIEIELKYNFSPPETFINKLSGKLITYLNLVEQLKIYSPFDLLEFTKNIDPIQQSIDELDVMLVNGGGYFNNLWYSWSRKADLFKIIIPLLIANNAKKNIFFMGNGYGPFDDSSEFFKCIFNSINNVQYGCRDNLLSLGYMTSLGVDSQRIKLIPDDLLVVNNEMLQKTINTKVKLPFENYILLETYLPLKDLKKNTGIIQDFAKKMYDYWGLSIVFVPFQNKEGGEYQGKFLKSILPDVRFYLYDINIHGIVDIYELLNLIRNSNIVLGTRYHSLVLALGQNKPVISIIKKVKGDFRYYYNKNYGVLSMVMNNQSFNYKYFLRLNFYEVLQELPKIYKSIIDYQTNLFNNELYTNQLEICKNRRSSYVKTIIKNQ